LHHLLADGWGLKNLSIELNSIYTAIFEGKEHNLASLPIQYAEYAKQQRAFVASGVLDQQAEFWKKNLYNLPKLELPTDYHRPERISGKGDMETFIFQKNLANALENFSKKNSVTMYTLILAAINTLLYLYTRQEDIVLATPVSNRSSPEIENLIGTFMNTVVLRTDLSGDPNFVDILDRTQKVTLDAFDNQDLPFDCLVDELNPTRSLNTSALFQFLFLFETANSSPIVLPNIVSTPINLALGTARFDIVLLLNSTERGLEGAIEYSTDLFKKSSILTLIQRLELVLKTVIQNEYLSLSKLDFLTASEKQLFSPPDILNFINESPQHVQCLFEQIVQKYPHKNAVISGNNRLTYAELNHAANQIAWELLQRKAKPGDRIGVLLDHSHHAILAIIGIIKARCVFVPIDPDYPQQRIYFILKDADLGLVITNTDYSEKITLPPSCELILLESLSQVKHNNNPPCMATIADPLYMIYTSGSTGQPKGVIARQKSVLNLLLSLEDRIYSNHPGSDNIIVNGSLSFDTSIKQIIQLFNGRCLHMIPREIRYHGDNFLQYIKHYHIDLLDCTPSQCQLLIRHGLLELSLSKKLIFLLGGEAIDETLWNILNSHSQYLDFYNLYGPTECTVDACIGKLSDYNTPSLGTPINHTKIYLLDKNKNPVLSGTRGEIYIAGVGVTDGYWHEPELTTEAFIKNPFSLDPKAIMYKTGDFGTYSEDGSIFYWGRADEQVKVNGHRVEVREIEATLASHPDIIDVKILTHPEKTHNSLVAFLVPQKNRSMTIDGEPRYLLDNGLSIVHLNKKETDFLYHDLFKNLAYFRHGICINENDVIFDVGANIGLFSLQAHFQNKNVFIHAFEPNPEVRRLTAINFSLYQVSGYVHEDALSNDIGEELFTFYTKLSFLSGLHGDKEQEKELVLSYINKNENVKLDHSSQIDKIIENRLQQKQIRVKTITLSHFIEKNSIKKIDLLKINVEKAEYAVIQGISEKDWSIINQVVLEIHDIHDRVDIINGLLVSHGFHTTIEKDWSLDDGQNIFYLYATRGKSSSNYLPVELKENYLTSSELHSFLEKRLPYYMIPREYFFVEHFPLTAHGKLDKKALLKQFSEFLKNKTISNTPFSETEKKIQHIWSSILSRNDLQKNDNFFDVGGHSLLLTVLHKHILNEFNVSLSLIDLFEYTTIESIAKKVNELSYHHEKPFAESQPNLINHQREPHDVAIIGMAGTFPQSKNLDEFWKNLVNNHCMISHFNDHEVSTDPHYVSAKGLIDDIEMFDADFFNYTPSEAMLMDPQHRLFIESAYEALESAGYGNPAYRKETGLFCGQTMSTYFIHAVLPTLDPSDPVKTYQAMLSNDKDHLALQVAYKLNLTGPCVTIQTACSTSLVAVHMACQSILSGECDMAIAGGVSITVPNKQGYVYTENGIFSSDGQCRAFDESANGTVPGNGCAAIVLKSLKNAIADGDSILAIIKASATNNDGHQKAGYTAPSIQGQMKVIQRALNQANISASSLSYIEAHGTGTPLGDPIEVQALQRVFSSSPNHQTCHIGSLKPSVGHLDAAAGIASLVKVVLSLQHQLIPATLNFYKGNTEIAWDKTPFKVASSNIRWPSNIESPRRAGISSFGIGGTNAHLILEEAPVRSKKTHSTHVYLLPISAQTENALFDSKQRLLQHLRHVPIDSLEDLCYTMQVGRSAFKYRCAYVVHTQDELIAHLDKKDAPPAIISSDTSHPVIFQYSHSTDISVTDLLDLFEKIPAFQQILTHCYLKITKKALDKVDEILTLSPSFLSFLTQYSLSKFLSDLNVTPAHLIVDHFGELIAACLSGVISLDDISLSLSQYEQAKFMSYTDFQTDLLPTILGLPNYTWYSAADGSIISSEKISTSNYWKQWFKRIDSRNIMHNHFTCDSKLIINFSTALCYWPRKKASSCNDDLLTQLNQVLATLWVNNIDLNWSILHLKNTRCRLNLPTYPFQKQRYWLDTISVSNYSLTSRLISEKESYLTDETMLEHQLIDIWQRCLGISEIDIDDDFFELGGNSLSAIQIIQQIQSTVNAAFTVPDLYSIPSIRNIIENIKQYS
jgi:amino acid adenylation domain-containing protein/FkbM family methyltransferase